MSYGGYEYNSNNMGGGYGGGGGFDSMGGQADAYGGGGGGFMAGDDTKAGKGSDKKAKDRQSLLPLSIKQIVTAGKEDDVYKVDGQEIHMVKIYGTVETWTEQATNYTWILNDGSGSIECKQWIEKESAAPVMAIREGTMVKCIGQLREFDTRLHVLVYDVKVVEDWNELTHHLLEVITTHLQVTRGPIPGSTAANAAAAATSSGAGGGYGSPAGSGYGASMGAMGGMGGMGMGGQRAAMGGGGVKNEAQKFNDQVHSVYSTSQDPNGMHYDNVVAALRNSIGRNVSHDELRRAVAALCDEGRLYSTLDDSTYSAT